MRSILLLGAALLLAPFAARAQAFDWQSHKGETITFLTENHPWSNAVVKKLPDFTRLTGITVQVDSLQEAQMRQRAATLLQSKSSSFDVFMSLKSFEGTLYSNAGWYADLGPLAADPKRTAPTYDLADFGAGLRAGETFGGKLVGIPLNIEGPIVYYRRDIFEKCKITPPATLDGLRAVAVALKACEPTMSPWASRGLKIAVPYALSAVLHNMGGDYFASGKPALCGGVGEQAIAWYAGMLKDFGPLGSINNSFLQLRELYGQGRAAMIFESSNEFGEIMKFPHRAEDTAIMLLPPAQAGSHPTILGWGLSMNAFSRKQDAGWLFMQWATSREMDASLAQFGIAPPRNSVASSAEYQKFLSDSPLRQTWSRLLGEMAATGNPNVGPPMARQPQAREIIGDAVGQVLLGTASAHDAACGADKALAAMLASET